MGQWNPEFLEAKMEWSLEITDYMGGGPSSVLQLREDNRQGHFDHSVEAAIMLLIRYDYLVAHGLGKLVVEEVDDSTMKLGSLHQ